MGLLRKAALVASITTSLTIFILTAPGTHAQGQLCRDRRFTTIICRYNRWLRLCKR
jgi:uncharacterized protein (DUF1778 family)